MEHDMARRALIAVLITLAAAACNSSQSADVHVQAAELITRLYSRSRLSEWNVRATAAGPDCRVLVVKTSMIMEDSMVEAMHYGEGAYDVYTGGLRNFMRERGFRGVAYSDPTGKTWTYDGVTSLEAEVLTPCH
jgi:hypothetical protein